MSEALTVRESRWVSRICSAWQKSVEGILETGRLLCDAKDDPKMQHGSWLQMIKHELPFSDSTAERLMVIWQHPQLSKSAHVPNLPPSWGTLYELTKLDDGQWALAEDRGLIRPDVQRKQIVAFRKSLLPAKPTVIDVDVIRPTGTTKDGKRVKTIGYQLSGITDGLATIQWDQVSVDIARSIIKQYQDSSKIVARAARGLKLISNGGD